MYDQRCEELARYFLTDDPTADCSESAIQELAQEIQDCVEDFERRKA